jgi:hypothetical protein
MSFVPKSIQAVWRLLLLLLLPPALCTVVTLVQYVIDKRAAVIARANDQISACLIDGRAYYHGALVRSGSGVLKCEHGRWVSPTALGMR